MLCSNCKTQNPDNEAHCIACGAPLMEAEAGAKAQSAPKKRRALWYTLASVAVAAAALLILWLCGVFGGGVHSSAEKAALSFAENYYAANYDEMCKAVYPAVINDEFAETFSQIMAEMEQTDFTFSRFTATDTQEGDSAECAEWTAFLSEAYGAEAEVTRICYVALEYLFSGSADGEVYEDEPASALVAVAEIDGAWYVVNGNEAKYYGYDSPDEAALVYFEAYCALDYDTMATAFYPDIDTDETRAGFDEVAAMIAELEPGTCSNFAVTDKQLRGSEDRELWTQRLKDEYGFEAVLSELYYVEITYDYTGMIDGQERSEALSVRVPVAEIDDVWYVIDGIVISDSN